ncbi:MAG: arginine--tRNA ligase [Deltaproteobacteria bacterium]|nr:arginine--tRNA ligase [Deltaproteobacteria bacterium]
MANFTSQDLGKLVQEAVDRLRERGELTSRTTPQVTRAKSEEHGDFTTNFAMVAAKAEQRKPRELAEALAKELARHPDIADVQVAGPGFVNLRLRPENWVRALDLPLAQGERFGSHAPREEAPIVVEFVSANPTGPLHVGHGRGAVVGDALVRLLRAAGQRVTAEYYWNDRGRQVRELGRSVAVRVRQLVDPSTPLPTDENWYRGDYVCDLAREAPASAQFAGLAADETDEAARLRALAALPEDDERFTAHGRERMQSAILATLAKLRVGFEYQESERRIAESIAGFYAELERRGLARVRDGALFLATEGKEGEDKDRVVRKSDGEWTYFATDLLYHADKLRRGFGRMINIWGADHHGYIPRMRAGLGVLGHPPRTLEVLLVQMVNLLSDGQPVKMSKRSGDFVTLDELIDEVGVDATRYIFLTRRHDSQLDFDIALAKRRTLDNPVFYAQYGHARLSAILRRAEELAGLVPEGARDRLAAGLGRPGAAPIPESALALPEEHRLARRVLTLPDAVLEAAEAREPHRIVYFVQELSQAFQSYYTARWKQHDDPVLPPTRLAREALAGWDWERTAARLRWIRAIRTAVRAALGIAGVEAPDRMEWSEDGDREEGG